MNPDQQHTAKWISHNCEVGVEIVLVTPATNVYCGYEVDHDSSTCSDCKKKIPCQYEVGKEFYKLGYCDFKTGDRFKLLEILQYHLRITDSINTLVDVPYTRSEILFTILTDEPNEVLHRH